MTGMINTKPFFDLIDCGRVSGGVAARGGFSGVERKIDGGVVSPTLCRSIGFGQMPVGRNAGKDGGTSDGTRIEKGSGEIWRQCRFGGASESFVVGWSKSQVREIFMIHVGCTRWVTSSTDNIMKIHACITLTVEFIRTCMFLFFFIMCKYK